MANNNYLEPFKKGRASTEESVREVLQPLVDKIITEREGLSFSPTLRGWCYLLEGLGVCTKGDFTNVQARITRARKLGILPLDITAEDGTRCTDGGCWTSGPLTHLIRDYLYAVPYAYSTCTIEKFTGYHIELFVEKLDLVGMLSGVTQKYKIPVTCSRGWSDLHSRAALLKRAAEYSVPTVILLFGDFDVGGLAITDAFKDNLDSLLKASGLDAMPELIFRRVGLNFEDIESLNLTWIDGLETSSGDDLANPTHKQHLTKPVQDYLKQYGARKCEANALLRCPNEAEKIVQTAIDGFIDNDDLIAYQEQQLNDRDYAQAEVDALVALL